MPQFTMGGINILNASTFSTGQTVAADTTNATGHSVIFNAADADFALANNATYTNAGEFDLQSDRGITGSGTFHNTGTFRKQASGGTSTVTVPFNNDGLIDVRSGTLSFGAGGSGSGTAAIGSSAALEIHGGTFAQPSVANDGVLAINSGGVGSFGTVTGAGSIIVGGAGTLSTQQITQTQLTLSDYSTLNLTAAGDSTVTLATIGNANIYGSAPDGTSAVTTPTNLNVSSLAAVSSFNLYNGVALNISAGANIEGDNVAGSANAAVNILSGAIVNHNGPGTTYFQQPLVTIDGKLNVYGGGVDVFNGGTHNGSIFVDTGASAAIAGGFSSSATIDTNGTFQFVTTPGPDVYGSTGNISGHTFYGSLKVEPGGTLGFTGIGSAGATFFDPLSTVTMGPQTTLNAPAATTVLFGNRGALNIGTANIGGGVIFQNPGGLTVGTMNLSGAGPTNFRFETYGVSNVGTLNLADGILRTGQENGTDSSLSVGTFNLSGGEESGSVTVNSYMNWTGGVIDSDYGHVTIAAGGTLDISGSGGSITQSGVLDVAGHTYTAGDLVVGNADQSNSVVNVTSGLLSIGGTLGVGNNGTVTGGSNSAKGVVNISGGELNAKLAILGNTTGGGGQLNISQSGKVGVKGVIYNDVTISGGTLSVTMDNIADDVDPVLNGSMVGGYQRNGAMYVSGGVVSSPYLKLGVTAGNIGTFSQTGGAVSVGTVLLGSDAGGIGSLSVTGGKLGVTSLLKVAPTGSVQVSGSGHLNLDSGAAVIDYTGTSPISIYQALLASGYDKGAWNGVGIDSDAAAASTAAHRAALGIVDNAQLHATSFAGQNVDSTSVLIRYTLSGDCNLDGKVDVVDLGLLASNWQSSVPLASAMAQFHFGAVAVPEPALLGLVVAVGALARRRRA